MGTSKGYIAPTTPHWSQAKRAVTSYINNGDSGARAYAANKLYLMNFCGISLTTVAQQRIIFQQNQFLLRLRNCK